MNRKAHNKNNRVRYTNRIDNLNNFVTTKYIQYIIML